MRFVRRSRRAAPRVSLILLDWSVRESFHVLHYLARQNVPRDAYEINVIEYYDRVSPVIGKYESEVDNWILLEMPSECYYHKHLMYNVGIVVSRGDIIMIGDSDAMVKENFIETITRAFEREPGIVYHIDQFRNLRRDFYPFNFPTFEQVASTGCINFRDGKTTGVLDTADPLHTRNYGACMCARRSDMIAIGGADMHIDYLGHICGPYDMTFRLVNLGRREIWDAEHFTYHTWHPGQAGVDNYLGPHDGRHMSTTSLEAITSKRIMPFAENRALRALRTGEVTDPDQLADLVIDESYRLNWRLEKVEATAQVQRWRDYAVPIGTYRGYRMTSELGRFVATPVVKPIVPSRSPALDATSLPELKAKIRQTTGPMARAIEIVLPIFAFPMRMWAGFVGRAEGRPLPVPLPLKLLVGLLLLPFEAFLAVLFTPAPLVGTVRQWWGDAQASAQNAGNVVGALQNLRRWSENESCHRDEQRAVALLESRLCTAVVALCARLGLLAPIDVRHVPDARKLEAIVHELAAKRFAGQLVISAAHAIASYGRVSASNFGTSTVFV